MVVSRVCCAWISVPSAGDTRLVGPFAGALMVVNSMLSLAVSTSAWVDSTAARAWSRTATASS